MKFLLVQVILVWCVLEKVATQGKPHYLNNPEENAHTKKPIIPILKSNFEQYYEGYKYSYETGNGIHAQETGYIKHEGDEKHETFVQQGTVTYHDEHGRPITLTYIADEHGFQPQGKHLPTPPPVPEAIKKALEEQHHGGHDEEQQYHQQQVAHSYDQKPQYNNY